MDPGPSKTQSSEGSKGPGDQNGESQEQPPFPAQPLPFRSGLSMLFASEAGTKTETLTETNTQPAKETNTKATENPVPMTVMDALLGKKKWMDSEIGSTLAIRPEKEEEEEEDIVTQALWDKMYRRNRVATEETKETGTKIEEIAPKALTDEFWNRWKMDKGKEVATEATKETGTGIEERVSAAVMDEFWNRKKTEELAEAEPAESSRGSRLDDTIERMLKAREQPRNGLGQSRTQQDLHRLENLEITYGHDQGDTLIVVEFPELSLDRHDCNGLPWRTQRFWVSSQRLLLTGSSVFKHLLSVPKQVRVKRRLGLSDCDYFVLDLTPPTEGDELASQLAELSLPACVRGWWISMERFFNKSELVSGHDDNCPKHGDVLDSPAPLNNVVFTTGDATRTSRPAPAFDLADVSLTPTRDIPDYCPIRHRVNIIRLVLAIHSGQDLVLNSAPRMYTLVELTKVFDCVDVVRDAVFSWLMDSPNTEFMDFYPEVALHVGWITKITDVTRATFRILVTEHTLDALAKPGEKRQDNSRTLFGRPRQSISDELQNIIQHSTLKFAERVQYTLDQLQGPMAIEWLLEQGHNNTSDVPEFDKLRGIPTLFTTWFSEHPVSVVDANRLPQSSLPQYSVEQIAEQCALVTEGLLQYLHNCVDEAIRRAPAGAESIQWQRNASCYVAKSEATKLQTIYSRLNSAQRLLSQHFWVELASVASNESAFSSCPLMFANLSTLGSEIEVLNEMVSIAYIPIAAHRSPTAGLADIWTLGAQVDSGGELVSILPSRLYSQIKSAIQALATKWTYNENGTEAPLLRSTHLALGALGSEEFKYLPLWADGNDDGTGGVFDELAVPDTDMGPVGPGPAYHTGQTIHSEASSFCPSEGTATMSDDSGETMTMTQGRSLAVAGSGMGRDSVIMVSGSVPASSFVPSSVATPRTEGGDDDEYLMMMPTLEVMRIEREEREREREREQERELDETQRRMKEWKEQEGFADESDDNMDWFQESDDDDDDDMLNDIDDDDDGNDDARSTVHD